MHVQPCTVFFYRVLSCYNVCKQWGYIKTELYASTKEFPWFVNKILVELMEVIYQTTCLQNWENIANIRAAAMQASIFAPRQNNCIFIMNQNTSPLHQVFLPLIESSQRPPQKDWIFHISYLVNSFYEVVNLVWYSNLLVILSG